VFDEEISTSKPLLEHSISILGVWVNHVITHKDKDALHVCFVYVEAKVREYTWSSSSMQGALIVLHLQVSRFGLPQRLPLKTYRVWGANVSSGYCNIASIYKLVTKLGKLLPWRDNFTPATVKFVGQMFSCLCVHEIYSASNSTPETYTTNLGVTWRATSPCSCKQ